MVTQSKYLLITNVIFFFFLLFWRRDPELNLSLSVKHMKTQGKEDFWGTQLLLCCWEKAQWYQCCFYRSGQSQTLGHWERWNCKWEENQWWLWLPVSLCVGFSLICRTWNSDMEAFYDGWSNISLPSKVKLFSHYYYYYILIFQLYASFRLDINTNKICSQPSEKSTGAETRLRQSSAFEPVHPNLVFQM